MGGVLDLCKLNYLLVKVCRQASQFQMERLYGCNACVPQNFVGTLSTIKSRIWVFTEPKFLIDSQVHQKFLKPGLMVLIVYAHSEWPGCCFGYRTVSEDDSSTLVGRWVVTVWYHLPWTVDHWRWRLVLLCPVWITVTRPLPNTAQHPAKVGTSTQYLHKGVLLYLYLNI